jgi:hypothetical protein
VFFSRTPFSCSGQIFSTHVSNRPLTEQITSCVFQPIRVPNAYQRFLFLLCLLIVCAPAAFAGEPEPLPDVTLTPASGGFFSDWFTRVDQAQADQPHWVTPIVTVTPRLEEELRYDQFWERNPGSGQSPGSLNSYGGGKGLELIPFEPVELIVGVPPYETRYGSENAKGFADWSPAFLVKYRFLSGNEQHGNYILTGFLSLSVPSGLNAFSMHTFALTPTIAAGKGWGDFDIQATVGQTFPFTNSRSVGDPLAINVAFQYHLFKVLWPEFEINYMHWPNGENVTKNQVLLTPGLIIGRIPLFWRVKALIGVGYQFAASPVHPSYQSNWILTARLPF